MDYSSLYSPTVSATSTATLFANSSTSSVAEAVSTRFVPAPVPQPGPAPHLSPITTQTAFEVEGVALSLADINSLGSGDSFVASEHSGIFADAAISVANAAPTDAVADPFLASTVLSAADSLVVGALTPGVDLTVQAEPITPLALGADPIVTAAADPMLSVASALAQPLDSSASNGLANDAAWATMANQDTAPTSVFQSPVAAPQSLAVNTVATPVATPMYSVALRARLF